MYFVDPTHEMYKYSLRMAIGGPKHVAELHCE